MKLDIDLLKQILLVFEGSPRVSTTFIEVQATIHNTPIVVDVDPAIAFHMELLADKELLVGGGKRGSIGLIYQPDGSVEPERLPIRLTAKGHDLLSGMNNVEVWAKLRAAAASPGGAGLGMLIQVAQTGLQAATLRRIGLG